MTSYDFVEQKIVKPLSNDMFITGAELATMLRTLEKSSKITRFDFGAKIAYFMGSEENSTGGWGEMTLEDTSRLDSDWRTAWNSGLKRLELIPNPQRSNAGTWSLDVAGVFVEEAAPPRVSWNTDYLDMDELISSSSERGILLEDNPWFVIDGGEYLKRDFSGEIMTPHPIINEKIANELHNHFRVSFSYIMREVQEYQGRDLKEYYDFYFELRTSPTLNYPTGGI